MSTNPITAYADIEDSLPGRIYPVEYDHPINYKRCSGYGWCPTPKVGGWAVTQHDDSGDFKRLRFVSDVTITGPAVYSSTEELTIETPVAPVPDAKKTIGAQWTTDDIRTWATRIPKWTVFTDHAGRVITVNAEGNFQGPGEIANGQHTLRNWGADDA